VASIRLEPQAPPPRGPRRCSPSWARLIAKVYQVDPLVCIRCGRRMTTIAFLTDQLSIRRILDHLGLSVSEQAKPPPPFRRSSGSPSTVRVGGCRPSGTDVTACRPERGVVRPRGQASTTARSPRQMSDRPRRRASGSRGPRPAPSYPDEAPPPRPPQAQPAAKGNPYSSPPTSAPPRRGASGVREGVGQARDPRKGTQGDRGGVRR